MAHESENARFPVELGHSNPGYDIESSDAEGETRYIEVKSLGGAWASGARIMLTFTQFETACELGECYWLYVVEKALDGERRRLLCIQDPTSHIDRVCFEPGWRDLSGEGMAPIAEQDVE